MYIIKGTKNMNPPSMQAEVSAFITEPVWQSICGLSELPAFNKLQQDMLDGAKHWD